MASPDERPKIVEVGAARRWAMAAFLVAFGTLTGVTNGTKWSPLTEARIATRWGMFSAPPRAQPMVIVGLPRRGGPPEVLFDPNAPDRPWLDRLRDVRERKLADNAARTPSIQQSYLAYLCRTRGAASRVVEIAARAALGMPERVVAQRTCEDERGAPP